MIAFPVPGKQKSADICQAFIDGAGAAGRQSDAAVFYGVVEANWGAWAEVKASGRDWICIDNSYFDQSRKTHFRVTKNRLQHSGVGVSDTVRLANLGVHAKPMKDRGERLVVAQQSGPFYRFAGFEGDWLQWLWAMLGETEKRRPTVLRPWQRDKGLQMASLRADLDNAWALVTFSSAAAITAVLEGVPVFSLSPQSAAWEMSGRSLFNDPGRAFPSEAERLQWAAVLADNQWTLDEIREGHCWSMLNDHA